MSIATYSTCEVETDLQERLELTEYNNLPFTMYMMLASDENPDVRYSLASNANIPMQALLALQEDENVYVSCRAKQTIDRIEKEETKSKMSVVHYGAAISAELGLISA